MALLVLTAMLFCHIIDDYVLQGWLATGKQKDWWKTNAPDKLYKYDYIMALAEHAFFVDLRDTHSRFGLCLFISRFQSGLYICNRFYVELDYSRRHRPLQSQFT